VFRSCAMPLLLAIILARANAYSRALATLRLSGTVAALVSISATLSPILWDKLTFVLHQAMQNKFTIKNIFVAKAMQVASAQCFITSKCLKSEGSSPVK